MTAAGWSERYHELDQALRELPRELYEPAASPDEQLHRALVRTQDAPPQLQGEPRLVSELLNALTADPLDARQVRQSASGGRHSRSTTFRPSRPSRRPTPSAASSSSDPLPHSQGLGMSRLPLFTS